MASEMENKLEDGEYTSHVNLRLLLLTPDVIVDDELFDAVYSSCCSDKEQTFSWQKN